MNRRLLPWRLRSKIRYWTSRWPLADLLNRSSRTCWADLVSWALRSKPLREVSDATSCRVESAIRRDRCYCGKFQNGCSQ